MPEENENSPLNLPDPHDFVNRISRKILIRELLKLIREFAIVLIPGIALGILLSALETKMGVPKSYITTALILIISLMFIYGGYCWYRYSKAVREEEDEYF